MNHKSTQAAIKNEANTELKNAISTLDMARTNYSHPATAQFFINVAGNDFLNFSDETPRIGVTAYSVKWFKVWM
jgi:peptidyl-prolyl cis-trans isomerase B (cyclophilin B)